MLSPPHTHSESEIIKSGIELEAGIPANEICNRLTDWESFANPGVAYKMT